MGTTSENTLPCVAEVNTRINGTEITIIVMRSKTHGLSRRRLNNTSGGISIQYMWPTSASASARPFEVSVL